MRLTDKINKIKYAATHHFCFLKKVYKKFIKSNAADVNLLFILK